MTGRRSAGWKFAIVLGIAALVMVAAYPGQVAQSQAPARVARIPGINPGGACNPGPEERPWLNPNQLPGCRSLEAIASMTLEEKVAELSGITGRSTNQRLGLVSGGGSDGPNGISTMGGVAPPGSRGHDVTAFAQAVTLAATWNRDLASQQGKAIGEEFVGKGSNSVLGPTINIMRTWHWGRNGETLSEDPYLTAEIAVQEIAALNKEKVLTVLKHYAGNNQENTRCGVLPNHAGIDARISEKALQEIYLYAFKASVERAKTGGIMCSYNQVNGTFSCNNPELVGYLRQWGFDGFIAPDAGFALRDPLTAALAGITRPGGAQVAGFVKDGKLTESDVDRMLYYNLTPYFRLGIYDSPSKGKADANVSTPEHQALARKVAEEGAVLLKNRGGVLPIAPPLVKSIAVIGDDAGPHVTIGLNGSGRVFATKVSVPLDAITVRAGSAIKVTYAAGTVGIGPLPAIPVNLLKPAAGEGQGLLGRYYDTADSTGVPVATRLDGALQNITGPPAEYYKALGLPEPVARGARGGAGGGPAGAAPGAAGAPGAPGPPSGAGAPPAVGAPGAPGAPGAAPGQAGARAAGAGGQRGAGGAGGPGGGGMGGGRAWSAHWVGMLTPPSTGRYLFSLTGSGTAQLYIDHKVVATMMRADFAQTVQGTIDLNAGRPVPVEVKFSNASTIMGAVPSLGWQPPDPDMRAKAVAAAKAADVAIVFAAEQLGEGQDKVTLPLPGDQDDLIQAVAEANPRTVVVLHTSNPVAMPWLSKVAAVIAAFYPGQEAGSSIASVLFGDVNPSGKLAMTFPASELQGPATHFLDYPGDGMTVNYSEGVLVGYRYYDVEKQEPLFPFGFGLSYTTFLYGGLIVQHTGGDQATVSVRVTNTGKHAGAEVVQLYLGFPSAAEEPPKQLRGFEKIPLKPGESKVVTMKLDKDTLGAWDTETHGWRVYPGTYSVMVGSSSRDIRLKGAFTIAPK